MLDPIDYKEPRCSTCGGREFYYPDKNAPAERIPVDRIIRKLDSLFDKNDMAEAGRLLRSWREEARQLKDKDGELEILSEMMGYYRKTREEERALESVKSGLELINELNLQGVSAATVTLNAATTLKAFGKAEEALPHYEKALKVYKELLSPDDERIAGLYNNYALALTDLGRCEEAEKLYLGAIEILKGKNENDSAVTYVNLAHLYEVWKGDKNKITDCLSAAYSCLNAEGLKQNGYHAYVCTKCAPSFGYFGFDFIKNELEKRAEKIYAGA